MARPFAAKTRGVFHCFGENAGRMRRFLEIGALVSFTGIVTFKNGQNVRDTLAAALLDRFILETDCPYPAPAPCCGQRCEPAYIKEIAETVARVKNYSPAEFRWRACETGPLGGFWMEGAVCWGRRAKRSAKKWWRRVVLRGHGRAGPAEGEP